MDTRELIIKMLCASLKNKKICFDKYIKDIDLEYIIKFSGSHQITSLIYNAIDRNSLINIDKKTLEDFKSIVIKSNMSQIYLAGRFNNILSDLNKLNKEVITLKGMVIRNYYPRPELRTMGDLDILIHKNDYFYVKEYLLKSGFSIKNENHPVHTEFIDKYGVSVEVHWKLINNETYVCDTSNFEKNLWLGIEKFTANNMNINILGKEDFLLHLCIHMAKHLRGTGFGLRQVYDIAAFLLKEQDNIDWIKFENNAKESGSFRFCIVLFRLINNLFDLNLYNNIIKENLNVDSDIEMLMDEILSYDYLKNSERKIYLNKKTLNDDKLLSYKKIQNQYTIIKRNVSYVFKDNMTKEIINRRKILLKKFEL